MDELDESESEDLGEAYGMRNFPLHGQFDARVVAPPKKESLRTRDGSGTFERWTAFLVIEHNGKEYPLETNNLNFKAQDELKKCSIGDQVRVDIDFQPCKCGNPNIFRQIAYLTKLQPRD